MMISLKLWMFFGFSEIESPHTAHLQRPLLYASRKRKHLILECGQEPPHPVHPDVLISVIVVEGHLTTQPVWSQPGQERPIGVWSLIKLHTNLDQPIPLRRLIARSAVSTS